MAFSSGQLPLADELVRILLDLSRATFGPTDPKVADALRIYGGIARALRGYPESWRALDEAHCILQSANAMHSRSFATLLWAQSNWYRWVDRDISLSRLFESLAMYEAVGPTPSQQNANVAAWIGWSLLHMGRHEDAVIYLDRARLEYESLGVTEHSMIGTITAAFGDLAAIEGDWPVAEARYRAATRSFEIAWAKRGATSRNTPLHGYNLMALAQAKQGKNEEAWNSLQHYRAGQTLRASIGLASWRVRTDPAYEDIRRMRAHLLANRTTALALKESPAIKPETWRALIDQLDLIARCARAENDYLLHHPLPEVSLDHLKAALDKRTAYVGWLDAKFGDDMAASSRFRSARWMYVIRSGEPIRWIPIWEVTTRKDDEAIRTKAHEYYAIVTRSAAWRGHLDNDRELFELAKDVYRQSFGSAASQLAGVDQLIAEFACYDQWTQVDALVDETGRYVSERYPVSFSPSASVFVALSMSPRRREVGAEPAVLAIGDPSFGRDLSYPPDSRIDAALLRGAMERDAAALNKLPRLPFAGREIDRIQALFKRSRVLQGREASESSLNEINTAGELSTFDFVHIASHAFIDRAPERCAIALSRWGLDSTSSDDGIVEATDIRLGWNLDAELVTLSACQTVGALFTRGEPMGFAQALFQAGTRCVLVSCWKVDDEATSLLMSRFYENIARGRGLDGTVDATRSVAFSDALAEAKNWLREYRDEKGNRRFAHPAYWSGFVLIGDAI